MTDRRSRARLPIVRSPRAGRCVKDECGHGLNSEPCDICQTTWVYVSGGGTKFHRTGSCSGLEAGKKKVDARYGERAPVQRMMRVEAENIGMTRCYGRDCWPAAWNR